MKNLIKNYRSILYVQVGDYFIKKDAIESITEAVEVRKSASIEIRTKSGAIHTADGKEAKRILAELCFNE